jgi:L-serine dehydratase
MEFISILNDVLGPIMRGPSSSHTAGSYHIGRIARALLGEDAATATFTFDPDGSYAKTYRQQGVDLALAAGLLGWPITDGRFARALDVAPGQGLRLRFQIARLVKADHPNTVRIELVSKSGKRLEATAKSVGGGMIILTELEGRPVSLDGKSHEVMILAEKRLDRAIEDILSSDGQLDGTPVGSKKGDSVFLSFKRRTPMNEETRARLDRLEGIRDVWTAPPIFYIQRGAPLFLTGTEMVLLARKQRRSLGQIALAYEAGLLGISEKEVVVEIRRRYGIMRDSVRRGLAGRGLGMRLLKPSAGRVFRAEARGGLAAGGLHTRAAARAMAALHVSNSMGIVCAAPTGGSAGVLPGVVVTLVE